MLTRSDARPGDPELADLLRVAAVLRDLPREGFKARLKDDLQRRAVMATTMASFIREGFHTLTPYLVVKGAGRVIDFARQAFGAQEMMRIPAPDGSIMHAEFKIGDSMVEIGDGNAQYPPAPTTIHLKVDDVDSVYQRALAAGGTSLYPPTDQEYGERDGGVKDPAGNHWYIGTPLADIHFLPEQRAVTPYLHITGAARCIDFLKRAIGAQEAMRHQTPDGIVHHAKVRIGDSVLEMGEAHGQFPAMPGNLHLYVQDADAIYRRALEAGAESLREPRDEPYGDRSVECATPSALPGGSPLT
jgi:PhnB protein